MAMILLVGGVASGKSRTAATLASQGARGVTVIATAEALDDEMTARIERHRRERPTAWTVVEEPVGLAAAIEAAAPDHVVIVDCLTLWVTNLMAAAQDADDDEVFLRALAAAKAAAARPAPTVVISNEVGAGIVPMHPLARRFRDVLGRVNAAFADEADTVALMVAGRAVTLSDPLATLDLGVAE
jgi:adenosyl cobinamide kinase/adenosyl cobinamide phosphate guanylyltransferase